MTDTRREIHLRMMASLDEGRSVRLTHAADLERGDRLTLTCGREERRAVVLATMGVGSHLGHAVEARVRLLREGE